MIQNHRDLTTEEFDSTVWRYLTFTKFLSLLTYSALWFPKLNILQDEFEGTIPRKAEQAMRGQDVRWKKVFVDPELQKQIDDWPDLNVRDGRELLVVDHVRQPPACPEGSMRRDDRRCGAGGVEGTEEDFILFPPEPF